MSDKTDKNQYITLSLEFDKFKTLPTVKYLKRKPYAPVNKKKVTAFIPGVIKKILVEEKKKVVIGQPLLILDAMKMNNQILSEVNGVVKKVNVKEGELVTKSQVLIELK